MNDEIRKRKIFWRNVQVYSSQKYCCGYCSSEIASDKGWVGSHQKDAAGAEIARIAICHHCGNPTYFRFDGLQSPSPAFGKSIDHLPPSVNGLYEEARRSIGANNFTAAVLCCRKLLMNISVSHGANAGESFTYYVDYLIDNHYVPPGNRDNLDHIRKKGNEANHEISDMTRMDAEELLGFIELVLRFMYEFPERLKKKDGN